MLWKASGLNIDRLVAKLVDISIDLLQTNVAWSSLVTITFNFVLLTFGWLERRRQNLFRNWANGSELCKLDSSGAAFLKDGELKWSAFEAGTFEEKDSFIIKNLN